MDNSAPFVSIIISSYNSKNHLQECLKSLNASDYPYYEIIVVDAGSTDGTPEMVREFFPSVRLITVNKRIGIGEAINIGISEARGDYFIFDLNTDEVVEKSWLRMLVEAFKNSPAYVGIVTGKRLIYATDLIDSAGGKIDYITGRIICIGSGRKSSEYDTPREVDCGFVLAVKKEVVRKIGLCDPDFHIYFEDVDFCIRAKKAGFKIMYIPGARSWHKGAGTIGHSLRGYYYIRRNTIRFIIKNFHPLLMIFPLAFWIFIRPILEAFLLMPFIRKLVLHTPFKVLCNININYIFAYIKAIIWNLSNLQRTISLRMMHAFRA